MPASAYPRLSLAQAILKTIADHTGLAVRGAEVCVFRNHLSVTVSLEAEGSLNVSFSDPTDPGPDLRA